MAVIKKCPNPSCRPVVETTRSGDQTHAEADTRIVCLTCNKQIGYEKHGTAGEKAIEVWNAMIDADFPPENGAAAPATGAST